MVDNAIASSQIYGPWQIQQQREEAALAEIGLPGVEDALDHIVNLVNDIHGLDSVIADFRSKPIDSVILPPDKISPNITVGSGSFAEKEIIPRTKTILFILGHDFDIDARDPEQIEKTVGKLKPNMMRKTSYDVLKVPGLERIILSCDEEGNRTFVFDSSVTDELDITQDILNMHKIADLDALIAKHPSIGSGLMYSKNFVARITKLLNDPTKQVDESVEGNKSYLQVVEKAPEDVVSVRTFAEELGTSSSVLHKFLSEHIDELGELKEYKFYTISAIGLSQEQQTYIRENFIKKAPEGVVSVKAFAKELGVAHKTLRKFMNNHLDELGELKEYRFNSNAGIGLSQEQQAYIRENMQIGEKPPEGVVPSPASLFIFFAACLIKSAPIFSPKVSSVSGKSTASATVTPSCVILGPPYDLPITTLRPFGPMVTLTASANLLAPARIFSRASSS